MAGRELAWFQHLAPAGKQIVMLVICLALALGAWAVLTYVPPETLEQLAAPFGVAMAAIVAVLANQTYHQLVNKANTTPQIQAAVLGTIQPLQPSPDAKSGA